LEITRSERRLALKRSEEKNSLHGRGEPFISWQTKSKEREQEGTRQYNRRRAHPVHPLPPTRPHLLNFSIMPLCYQTLMD
jgi:hypothetical protein